MKVILMKELCDTYNKSYRYIYGSMRQESAQVRQELIVRSMRRYGPQEFTYSDCECNCVACIDKIAS